jgi:hypothetical protein
MDWIDASDWLPEVNEHGNSEPMMVWITEAVNDNPSGGAAYVHAVNQAGIGQLTENQWRLSWPILMGRPQITHWQPLPDAPAA